MRKLLLTLLASVLSLTAFSGGIPLLDKVEGHRVVFHYTYLLSRDGKPMEAVTDGDVVVEDKCISYAGARP